MIDWIKTINTIEINNDEAPPFPLLNFDMASATYNEDAGTVNIAYTLSYATTASTDVELTTSGTANTNDFNFSGSTANPYSFTIPVGTTTGNVSFSIVDDTNVEPTETVIVNITNVTGGAIAGSNTQHTINITDNDFVPFNYLETFESFTSDADASAAGFTSILNGQTVDNTKVIGFLENSGSFTNPNDVNMTSDKGLNIFYNASGTTVSELIDNVYVSPIMMATGNFNVKIDNAYAFKNQNSATITYYYSETYNESGTFNSSEWQVMGTETAADMDANGFGNNVYKRQSFNITTSGNFYIAIRINQTVDATNYRTRWRFDNLRVDSF